MSASDPEDFIPLNLPPGKQAVVVPKLEYVAAFALLFILLTLLTMRVDVQTDIGLQRVERLRLGSGLMSLFLTQEISPQELEDELNLNQDTLVRGQMVVDAYLGVRDRDRFDWTRPIQFQGWIYRFIIGPEIILNLATSWLAAAYLYTRRRRLLAEELIQYQENRFERTNQRLEAKMLESIRIIEKFNTLQDKLVEAEKLASIGRLSATLAHEIRNPLTIIKSATGIIADDAPSQSGSMKALELIRDEINRLDRIITDLLNFARPKPPRIDSYNVKSLVRHWLPPVVEELEKFRIQLVPELEEDIGDAYVDPDQLWQVFLNIMWNARDAMQGVPNPHIFVRLEDDGSELVRVVIQDTGVGMLPDVLRQIREPFFTTKTQGSGLGIPVSIQLLEGMGGRLDISSDLEKGTIVSLHLPRAPRKLRDDNDEMIIEALASGDRPQDTPPLSPIPRSH